MVEEVKQFAKQYKMLEQHDRVIVGVSGGADSVCLLFVLLAMQQELNLDLYVIHVNHGLRGLAAKQDENFVIDLCKKKGLPYEVYQVDVIDYVKNNGASEEEAARILRYDSFWKAYRKYSCNKIAIAHNMNDQAETMMFHMFRGSGMKGLSGIAPVREPFIRPLLCVRREEIEQYLTEQKQRYCTDMSNFKEEYSRNKIRLKMLPYVERELNSKAIENMSRCANMLRETERYLERTANQVFDRIVKEQNRQYSFSVEEFLKEDVVIQKRLIRIIFQKINEKLKDFEEKHVLQVIGLVEKTVGKSVDLPYGLEASRTYQSIEVRKKGISRKVEELHVRVEGPGTYYIPVLGQNVRISEMMYKKNMIIPKNSYTKWFDYDKIKNTIFIRNRMEGDYFQMNSSGGNKKLKSFFIDEKIPKEERNQIPLLCDGNHVIWIIGNRISEKYKICEQTKRVLIVELDGGKHDR